jgi:polyphosphate:AMP phosphotransferase
MLETAEVGHRIDKQTYAREEPKLREALVNAQFDFGSARSRSIVVLISGVEAAGRAESAIKLTEWMDPRHLRVHAFGEPTEEETAHPAAWRYWRALPAHGRIAVFMNGWYSEALNGHPRGEEDLGRLDGRLAGVRDFERMLAREHVVVVKFWIHLSSKDQKRRLAELDRDKRTTWQITSADWARARQYGKHHNLWEHALRETSADVAPWYVVEGADQRYRDLTVGRILLDTMHRVLAPAPPRKIERRSARRERMPTVIDNVKLVRDLDLTQKLSEARYDRELVRWQGRLARATSQKTFAKRSLIVVFEGADAAGKGSSIRRVVHALHPSQYTIVPIAAPTDEELAHPYLWRFWRQLPRRGQVVIFDRSWYGRVLVERVEGFAEESAWMRAYDEIVRFEEELVSAGAVVCKVWLQISKDEQMRRFKAREKTPFKRFKITADDWRNRRRWNDYERAVCDMVERTSTEIAPWTLVEANDKRFARIKVLRTIVKRLEAASGARAP